jgi:hypothetical protein
VPTTLHGSRKPLHERSREELYNEAKKRGIGGRSKMNKQELVRAIGKAQ